MEQVAYSQEVIDLLVACDLPVSDLRDNSDVYFFGFHHESELWGVIGVEVCGDYGLLRSLAISAAHRSNRLGQKLVAFSEEWAARSHLKALYLLTTTADGFFARLGYEVLDRSDAPRTITQTPQFAGLCPASSVCMGKALAVN
ncbi:GNAT family N-acetyltransferase [Halomonas sp. ISL-60]|uniref:arsenic resistance N-acetyltransferase ArsN2 n=1 Tax=Halomonas sp. ISL-56 TaxID=2819149 RepID=UPI001BEA7C5B|nr:arsenic resistance N-acetyltransferase ArsN2 [Halomonas sp. ISL-56]MBT2774681.1 GNAT family N-acetyltransferase [Halomonas sp. ISL-60]MBT2803308.1 GNAT family N-acetyltransferase [Halomonas sp. ISL-56]